MSDMNGEHFVPPNTRKAWIKFFQDWRAEAIRVAPDRFRDALRQASYSLLRTVLDAEEEWIKTVQDQRNSASTTSASTAGDSTGFYTSPESAYPHLYRRHFRIMNRIERHSRR
jgi:hypothetical protein